MCMKHWLMLALISYLILQFRLKSSFSWKYEGEGLFVHKTIRRRKKKPTSTFNIFQTEHQEIHLQ